MALLKLSPRGIELEAAPCLRGLGASDQGCLLRAPLTRFQVDFQCGCSLHPRPDIAIHFNPRFHTTKPHVICNTLQHGRWQAEARWPHLTLQRGASFLILFLFGNEEMKVSRRGGHHCLEPVSVLPLSCPHHCVEGHCQEGSRTQAATRPHSKLPSAHMAWYTRPWRGHHCHSHTKLFESACNTLGSVLAPTYQLVRASRQHTRWVLMSSPSHGGGGPRPGRKNSTSRLSRCELLPERCQDLDLSREKGGW